MLSVMLFYHRKRNVTKTRRDRLLSDSETLFCRKDIVYIITSFLSIVSNLENHLYIYLPSMTDFKENVSK